MQKETPEFDDQPTSTGGKSRLPLLVLLLLVAGFGYLYFFTDLIRPKEQALPQVAEPAPAVKMPLPPRQGQLSSAKSGGAPAAVEAGKPAAGQVAAPVTPATAPAPAVPKKAEPAQAQKAVAPGKPAAVKPAEQPKAVVKPAAKKEAKSPVPTQQAASPKKEAKAVSAKKSSEKASAKGSYTLKFGEFVVVSSMNPLKDKLRKAGLTPVVKNGPKKSEPMIRLFLGEYDSMTAARSELDKLKAKTVEGFVLKENGRYVVYAGSYYLEGKAAREQDRLNDLGIKLTMKKASVAVPTLYLTAGSYATKDAAQAEATALKKKGLNPVVIQGN